MSNSVDQRIVQMMFDNSQFEKGVSSTLQSLKALDEGLTLKKGSSGIEQVQKSVNGLKFDNAISQTSGFEKALGSLKNTAGGVFSSIMDAVGNMSSGIKVVTGLLGTGLAGMMVSGAWRRASNINMAEFKLRGMYEAMGYKGKEAGEMVELAMQNASDAVDGTAYALDSAVMAASNLAASGVQAGEELEGTLRSIAGLAAMSGRDYDSVAQIVSTVAGQGQLMTMQLRQFEMSGLNVAAILADAFGATESEIRKMVTDGKVSFEVFSQVMEEKFAGAAAKANETFDGSLANIRAALSRTFATLFVYGQKGMVPVFNGIREAINGVNTALSPLLGENGVITKGVYKTLSKTGKALRKWAGYVDSYEKDAEGNMKKVRTWFHQDEIDKMTRFFKGIADAMKTPMKILAQVLPNVMMGFMYAGGIIREVTRLFGELISPVFTAFGKVFSDKFFGDLTGWLAGLVKHLYDFVSAVHIGRAYGAILEGVFTALFSIVKAVSGVIGSVFTVAVRIAIDILFAFAKGIEIVLDVIGTFLDMISWGVKAVGDFFKNLEESDPERFGAIAKTFRNIGEGAKLILDVISGKEGAFDSLVEFVTSIDEKAGANLKSFGTAFEFVGKVFEKSGTLIHKTGKFVFRIFHDLMKPALEPLGDAVSIVAGSFKDAMQVVGDGISSIIPEDVKKTADSIGGFVSSISQLIDGAGGDPVKIVSEGFKNLRKSLEESDAFKTASADIESFANGLVNSANEFKAGGGFVGMFGGAFDSIKDSAKGLVDALSPLGDAFKNVAGFFGIEGLKGNIQDVRTIFENLKQRFDDLNILHVMSEGLIQAGKGIMFFAGAVVFLASSGVTAILDTIKSLVAKIAPYLAIIGMGFQQFGVSISNAFTELLDSFAKGSFGIDSVNAFVDAILQAFSSLGHWIGFSLPKIGAVIWDFFKENFMNLGENLKGLLKNAGSSALSAVGDFVENLGLLERFKGTALEGPLNALKDFFTSVVPANASKIVDVVGDFLSFVSSNAFSAADTVLGMASSGLTSFFDYLSGVGGHIISFKDSFVESVKGLQGLSQPFDAFFGKAKESLDWFFKSLELGGSMKDALPKLVTGFKMAFDQLVADAGPVVSEFAAEIQSSLKENFEHIVSDFGGFIGSALSNVPKAIGNALEGLDSLGIFEGLKDAGFEKPLQVLQNFFQTTAPDKIKEIANSISAFLAPSLGGLMDFGSNVFRIFSETDFLGPFKTFGSSIGDALTTFFNTIEGQDVTVEAVKTLAHSIADAFGQFITDAFGKILDVGGKVFGALTSAIGGPFEKIVTFLGDKLSAIPGFLKGLFDVIASFDFTGNLQKLDLSGILTPIKEFVSEALHIDPSKLPNIEGIIGTIKDTIKSIFGLEKDIESGSGFDKSMLKMETGSIYRKLFSKYFGRTDDLDGEVTTIGDRVKQILGKFKEFIHDPLGTIFDVLSKAINTFSSKYAEFKGKVNKDDIMSFVDDITEIAKHAAGLIVLWEVVQMFENVGHFASSMARMADAFRSMAFELKNLTHDTRMLIRTQAILNIVIALGIIIAAVLILAHQPLDQVWAALEIVERILVELVLVVLIFNQVKLDPAKIAGVGKMVASLAIAIAGLALVAMILGGMDQGELTQGLDAVKALMLMFGLLMAVTMVVPEHFGQLKGTFLGIAGALLVITVIIQILGSMDPMVLSRGGALLIGLMVLLGVLAASVQHFSKGTSVGATALIEMAAAILVLTAAIGVLAMIPSDRLDLAVFEIIGLIAAMTLALIAITRFTKQNDLKGTGKALAGFAASIIIISIAIGMLSFIGSLGGDLFGAMVSILLLLGVMTGVIIAISAMGEHSEMAAKAIQAFGVAIGILAVAVVALSLIPAGKVVPALIGLCATIIVFAGALTILTLAAGKFKGGAGLVIGMLVAIGAMALMVGGAISWLADSLKKSSDTTSALAVLCVGLIAFSAALIALMVAAQVCKPGAVLVMGILLSIGAMALMVANAVNIFADGLIKLSIAGPRFITAIVSSLKALGQGLWNAKESLAMGVGAIGTAIIQGFLSIIPGALQAFAQLFLGVVGVIVQYAPIIGEGGILLVIGLINGIANGIDEHGGEVLDAIGHLFDIVIEGVAGIFEGALTSFGNWLSDITGIGTAAEKQAKESAGKMSEAASEGAKDKNTMVEDAKDTADGTIMEYLKKIPGMNETGGLFSGALVGGAKEGAKGFNFLQMLGLDGESMNISLSEVSERAKAMGIALPENITTMVEGGLGDKSLSSIMDDSGFIDTDAATAMAEDAGVSVATDGWGTGLEEGLTSTAKLDDLLEGTGVVDLEAIQSQFSEAGSTASTAFSSGFSESLNVDGSGPVKKAANAMKMDKEFSNAGNVNGKAVVSGMEKGMKNLSSKVKNTMSSSKKEVDNSKAGIETSAKSVGSGLVEGMISGINSQLPSLKNKVEEVIALVDKAARKRSEMNSPSKMTARIGSGLVEGLILGMEQMHGSLQTTSEDTADLAIGTVATQMSYLSGLLEDIEAQPVIRPVLDLTDYNAGLAQMASLDTYGQTISAQMAMRGLSVQGRVPQEASNAKSGPNISIFLNYDASADANQIVMDIANGLETRLAMEGA